MADYKNTPLWNNKLPIEERLDYLINELTLEEKITCLTTGCPDIERLGIKASYMGGEAAHGIEARHDQAFNFGTPEPTTSFTQPIGMSGSFDKELIKECGRAVGEEARALFTRNGGGGLCRWAPTIDMERDPRWGRNEEAYGEDPYLTGEMAGAYIRGMKGEHPFYLQTGATLKHFYANNVEKDRIKVSSSIDMRNKYEYYLEPFRRAIEHGAEAIMTSYNEINGIPAIVNSEVQDILKDTYGLPGHVVCDGGDFQQTVYDHKYFETHAETVAYGLKAGVDGFTDNGEVVFAGAKEAIAKGLMTEEDVNRSIRNSFRTRIRFGFFDSEGECPYTGMGEEYVNNEEHQALSAQMAKEAVVLLKNQNDLLPIKPEEVKSLAVVGPLADVWYKDWYCGIPPYSVTPLDGIKKKYAQTAVSYESGLYDIYLICNDKYVGLDETGRLHLTDRENAEVFQFTDWGCGSTTLRAASNGLFVTLEEGSYLIKADKKETFSWFIRESWCFKEVMTGGKDVKCDNPTAEYYMDSWNGRKVTIDEDGYLVVIKTDEVVPGEGDDEKLGRKSYAVSTGKPVTFSMEIVTDGIADAVSVAQNADKAVVVIGSNPVINSKEEIDRTTLALPPAQQRLVDSVLSANPNTVVVLVTNYPYTINELQEKVPAILYTASGSQELGSGIAAVLSGEVSPAGRLPQTWYHADHDLPDIEDYDIIKGKRTYQYFDREVLYPFGYGLSYTEFAYETMVLEQREKDIKVTLAVTNTGKTVSDEVVQLYVHKEQSRVKQPRMQLVAFDRVKNIRPGETRIVTFHVNYADLTYFDVISRKKILEEGNYTLMAGASACDIRQKETFYIKGEKAPLRNPFVTTKAEQYDDYENCFLHRGAKGHTTPDNTCVIPGKAGDAADIVDKTAEEKVCCELSYRDFAFEKIPEKVMLRVCGVEDGEVELCCKASALAEAACSESVVCTIAIRESSDLEFVMVEAVLPKDFIGETGTYELTITIRGKVKLSEFRFM